MKISHEAIEGMFLTAGIKLVQRVFNPGSYLKRHVLIIQDKKQHEHTVNVSDMKGQSSSIENSRGLAVFFDDMTHCKSNNKIYFIRGNLVVGVLDDDCLECNNKEEEGDV